jgi:hypothetical protein
MLYNKEQLPDIFNKIDELISASGIKNYKEPAPIYIYSDRWNDELREKNGYTLIDGEWYKVNDVQAVWDVFKKDVEGLMDDISEQREKIDIQHRRIYEMEYGLRVAERALKNSLAIVKRED